MRSMDTQIYANVRNDLKHFYVTFTLVIIFLLGDNCNSAWEERWPRLVGAVASVSSLPGSNPGWGHCVLFLGKTNILTVPCLDIVSLIPGNQVMLYPLKASAPPTCRRLLHLPGTVTIISLYESNDQGECLIKK